MRRQQHGMLFFGVFNNVNGYNNVAFLKKKRKKCGCHG